jgi:hypothetical protein
MARCYPPRPEDGAFPELKFFNTIDDSASAAPTTSRAEGGKRKRAAEADRVEYSEESNPSDSSCDKELDEAIPAKPISSRPYLKIKESRIDNYDLGDS